jgi:hypothetical protein
VFIVLDLGLSRPLTGEERGEDEAARMRTSIPALSARKHTPFLLRCIAAISAKKPCSACLVGTIARASRATRRTSARQVAFSRSAAMLPGSKPAAFSTKRSNDFVSRAVSATSSPVLSRVSRCQSSISRR